MQGDEAAALRKWTDIAFETCGRKHTFQVITTEVVTTITATQDITNHGDSFHAVTALFTKGRLVRSNIVPEG
jgi:hypothetical protein